MDESFSTFLDTYLDIWRNSSLVDLKNLISQAYEARELKEGVGVGDIMVSTLTTIKYEFARMDPFHTK